MTSTAIHGGGNIIQRVLHNSLLQKHHSKQRARASTNGQQREPRALLFKIPRRGACAIRHVHLAPPRRLCPIIRLTLHALYAVVANSHRFCRMALRLAGTSAHPHCVVPHLFSSCALLQRRAAHVQQCTVAPHNHVHPSQHGDTPRCASPTPQRDRPVAHCGFATLRRKLLATRRAMMVIFALLLDTRHSQRSMRASANACRGRSGRRLASQLV